MTQTEQSLTIAKAFETRGVSENKLDCFSEIKRFRPKHPKNIIVAYLSMTSIRNKFENFSSILSDKVNCLAIAETEIDSSFPTNQLKTNRFKIPYRLGVSRKSGRILVHVNEGLISRELDV